ncbi:hypothetical protein G9A89_000736 [Geosiphon pyriformis]|nr:hypothetical protein G9A89_000736 [Geosiphon pyriformis]
MLEMSLYGIRTKIPRMMQEPTLSELHELELLETILYESPSGWFLLDHHFQRLYLSAMYFGDLSKNKIFWFCNSQYIEFKQRVIEELNLAIESNGKHLSQRVRLTINPQGISTITTTLLSLPNTGSFPLRVKLDTQPTPSRNPFLFHKTTNRAIYEEARQRAGTIKKNENNPSGQFAKFISLRFYSGLGNPQNDIFDVILYNERLEITECSIANIAVEFKHDDIWNSGELFWKTPKIECGLLAGVMRSHLLENENLVEGVITVEELKEAQRTLINPLNMVLKKSNTHPATTTRLGKVIYLVTPQCNVSALLSSASHLSNSSTTLIYQNFDQKPNRKEANVLILTPLKDASPVLPTYFENIARLSFPKERLSFGFLVSDSTDDTFDDLIGFTQPLVNYRRITILQKNFGFILSHGDRHDLSNQAARRSIMAQSRNYLLFGALNDEDWVLWLDVDLKEYPETLLDDLIAFDTDVVTPNVFAREKHNGVDYVYDRNNFIETRESRKVLKGLDPDDVLVEGYADLPTYRRYLGDLRNTNKDIVKVDGVGGACLMVKANVHREGALFPTFPIDHELETEGFAKMAKKMGKQVCGLPNYVVYHP